MTYATLRRSLVDLLEDATADLDTAPAVLDETPATFTGALVVITEAFPWVSPDRPTFADLSTRWEIVAVAPATFDAAGARAWLDAAAWAITGALLPESTELEATPHLTVTHGQTQHRACRFTATITLPLSDD